MWFLRVTDSLFDGEDGVDGGGFFDLAGVDGERQRLPASALAPCACIISGRTGAGLDFVAGVEERAELDVEALGHLLGLGAGALEGFGGGFGLRERSRP